jgi:hypothetical protein
MELEQRKKLYEELKNYEGGIKAVADALKLTTNHVRTVMTRFETHKSIEVITTAVLDEIKKRRAAQTLRLKEFLSELV